MAVVDVNLLLSVELLYIGMTFPNPFFHERGRGGKRHGPRLLPSGSGGAHLKSSHAKQKALTAGSLRVPFCIQGSVDRGAHQSALEACLSQLVVPLSEVFLRKDLLRTLPGSLSAGLIDLLGPLPCGCDQTHFAVQHAQQAAHTGGTAALAVRVHDMRFAHAQRGAVIPVLGKDGDIAVDGAADDALGLPVKGAAVRRDHRQMKGRHGLQIGRASCRERV